MISVIFKTETVIKKISAISVYFKKVARAGFVFFNARSVCEGIIISDELINFAFDRDSLVRQIENFFKGQTRGVLVPVFQVVVFGIFFPVIVHKVNGPDTIFGKVDKP